MVTKNAPTDTDQLAMICERLGDTLIQLARELRNKEASQENGLGVSHMGLPWSERTFRQSLILADIVDRGGSVPKDEWYKIAARYGYSGRGLAGFFRSDGTGMLELKNEKVIITRAGKARLKENKDRVDAWRSEHPEVD